MRISSAALRAGKRSCGTLPPARRGTVFSASLKESVAAAVSLPASPKNSTLCSSGFIAEVDAQYATLRIARTKSLDFALKERSADTRGKRGKSSCGTVFIDAVARSVSTLNTSPLSSTDTVLPLAFDKNPSSTAPGTATTPSPDTFAGNSYLNAAFKIGCAQNNASAVGRDQNAPQAPASWPAAQQTAPQSQPHRSSCSVVHSNFILSS